MSRAHRADAISLGFLFATLAIIALKLARALGQSVEELFSLGE